MQISIQKRCFIGALTIMSVVLSLIHFYEHNPAERTMSSIGRENSLWFLVWGMFTGSAIYLNLKLLAKRLDFRYRWFGFLVVFAVINVLLTTIVNGTSRWEANFHWATAMMFGVTSAVCVFILLGVKRTRKRCRMPYLTIVTLAAVVTVIPIPIIGLSAMSQLVMLNACLAVLFYTNFIERWPFEASTNQVDDDAELCSVLPVQTSIADGLGDMFGEDFDTVFQVGDSSCNTQDS